MVSSRPTSNSAADSRRVSPGSSANSSPASLARRHIETTSCSPCRTIVASVKPRPEVGMGLRFTFVTVTNSAGDCPRTDTLLPERLGNGERCKGCTVAGRAKNPSSPSQSATRPLATFEFHFSEKWCKPARAPASSGRGGAGTAVALYGGDRETTGPVNPQCSDCRARTLFVLWRLIAAR